VKCQFLRRQLPPHTRSYRDADASRATATVGLVPPKPEAIEKHPLGLGRKHVPSRRVQAPDVPLFPQSPDGVIKPTYRRR